MVEGHQCHRVAHAHRSTLLHKRFEATSPNKRFVDGTCRTCCATLRVPTTLSSQLATKHAHRLHINHHAHTGAAAINDKYLARIEVHGKNLFYFFTPSDDPDHADATVIRIHFGMSGAFRTYTLPGPEELKDTIRLQLVNRPANIMAHVSAMSLEHGGWDFYRSCVHKLGQDALRPDADPEYLWQQVQKSKKPIGLVLMDQSMVAGPGNIYRAEILFKVCYAT